MNTNNIIILIVGLLIVGFVVYFSTGTHNFYRGMMGGEEMSIDEMEKEMNEHMDERVAEYEIYPSDVVKKIKNKEDIVLLDVRTPGEYKEVHLQGARLLPVQELSQKSLNEIGLDQGSKDKEIYLYCRSGARSKTAYDIMSSLGYTNIKSIAGGMIHWQEDKYPYTEKGVYDDSMMNLKKNDSVTPKDGPKISLNSQFYDFGLIPQFGGVVEKTFTIKNKGNKDLIIGDITTSCSCTSAKITNKTIKTGKEAILTVVFDPNFHGEPLDVFKRTVFIPTNDPQTPEAEVVIQVDINEGK